MYRDTSEKWGLSYTNPEQNGVSHILLPEKKGLIIYLATLKKGPFVTAHPYYAIYRKLRPFPPPPPPPPRVSNDYVTDSEGPDHTVLTHRHIWVFAGRICPKILFHSARPHIFQSMLLLYQPTAKHYENTPIQIY